MIRKFCLTLAVVSTALISMVNAQQSEKVTSSGIGYLEYLPQGYHSNSNKYPVVISLHGIKEKGTSSTDAKKVLADLHKVDNVGLPKYVKYGAKYPFILISPQLKSNQGSWPPSYIIQVLNHVKKYLRIDDRRVYLTGLSLGGLGVWKTAGEYPEVFAAIAPICPGGNALSKADEIAAHNVATWGFHGDRDNIVSHTVTTKMINAMNSSRKKPNPLAKATIFPGMGHIIWDRAYQKTNLLDWMLTHRKGSAPPKSDDDGGGNHGSGNQDDDKEKPSNKFPSVNAGPDRTLVLPATSIDLQGRGDDPDGKIASWQWTKISGGSASLSGTTSPTLRAYNLKEGSYVFQLTAKDDAGATRSDKMLLVVKKSSGSKPEKEKDEGKLSSKNSPPTAYAGPDRVLTLPTNAVTISSNTSDKDGKIVSYEWAKTYGRQATLSGANSPTVRISNLERGVYIFRLRVKDDDGAVKEDYFKITVNAGQSHKPDDSDNESDKPSNKRNSPPEAYAGPDRVMRLPSNSATIQSQASDKDGRIVSYEWTKTYGKRATLSGERSSTLKITNMERGVYIFRLTVKDNDGAVKHDYFKITVHAR